MFCPNCGVKIINPNQNFCIKCGSKIQITSDDPQLRPERSHSTLGNKNYSISQKKPTKIEGSSTTYSNKCLGFAIASIALLVFGIIFSGPMVFFGILLGRMSVIIIIIIIIIIISIHIVGLTFGILSRTNQKKAEKLEPENVVEKLGSVFMIFGIILNIIAIGITLVVFPFLIFR